MSLVETHYNDVFYLVDANYTYVQETIPRFIWIKLFPYEINVDQASVAIKTLLVEEINKNETSFGNYEKAKSRITIDLKIAIVLQKKKNLLKR